MNKVKTFIGIVLSKIIFQLKEYYIYISYLLLANFLIIALIYLVIEIASPSRNSDFIISTAIEGVIVSATLTVLTFTYALILDYPERVRIIKTGKIFLFSTLNFIIGLIYINISVEISHTTSFIEFLDEYIAFFLLIIGLVLLMISAISFAVGISRLLQNLLSHYPSKH